MALSTDQVTQLASQGPLSTTQVQNLATPSTPAPTGGITPQQLAPQTPISVPGAPAQTTRTSDVAGGTAQIDANNANLTPAGDGQASALGTPPSATDQYNTDYNASGVAGLQNNYNTDLGAYNTAKGKFDAINAQLQGLNAQAKAIPIQTQENAANGGANVTKGGLAPQNTAALRNNALQALPLQAQALAAQAEVAAAQGKASLSQSILQQAQDHLDKVYQIHQTDATAQYNYRTNLIDKAMTMATEAQKTKLAAQKATLTANNTSYQAFINDMRTISANATQGGQAYIAAKITQVISGLDPTSSTYQADFKKANDTVAALQGQITAKPTAAAKLDTSVVDVGGRKLLVNNQTGATVKDLGESTSSTSKDSYSFTPTIKTYLSASGETSGSISQLEKDIGQYGAQYVLDNGKGLTPQTQKVIENTFGISQTPVGGSKPFSLFDPSTW